MSHQAKPAFACTSGPRNARMVLVGEAHGESEQQANRPFAGESGKELFRMAGEAMPDLAPQLHAEICDLHKYGLAWLKRRDEWLAEASILLTNVFAFRPSSNANKLEAICCKKDELPDDYVLPSIDRGLYVRSEFLGELDRLVSEIENIKPNLIVCLGNVACWAILQATNISSIRGAITTGQRRFAGMKVLPTFHPAGVMRQWNWRPIVLADLMKARRESQFPDIRRPIRQIIISPTLNELREWAGQVLHDRPRYLACDTETEHGQIKCIGFAPSRDQALVVPFADRTRPGGSYWPTIEDELVAWQVVRQLLESSIPKIWQNGLYDLQYILKSGIRPRNNQEDTMLLHHSLFPELQKGLGFLGSIYSNEPAWKLMRKQKPDTEKRDE